jgi:hypothetical protein
MQNLNIIPVSATVGDIDDGYASIGCPPYIIAEGQMVAYYGAFSTGATTYSIALATCPVRTYPSLDVDSKSVGTYQKSPMNQFQKKGIVIAKGGVPDLLGCILPTAVYNTKEKKFMVYYIGVSVGPVYKICLATGTNCDNLVKYSGNPIITAPAGSNLYNVASPMVVFDKEENLYKIYYNAITTVGSLVSSYVATSKGGYDF